MNERTGGVISLLADGVLGLVVWPIAALYAPALIELGGASSTHRSSWSFS